MLSCKECGAVWYHRCNIITVTLQHHCNTMTVTLSGAARRAGKRTTRRTVKTANRWLQRSASPRARPSVSVSPSPPWRVGASARQGWPRSPRTRLDCCYTVVTRLLHGCYTVVTLAVHCCYSVVTHLLHCSYTVATLLGVDAGFGCGHRSLPAVKEPGYIKFDLF
jgi:hypothetical protein